MMYLKVFGIRWKRKIGDGMEKMNGVFYMMNMERGVFENLNLVLSGYGLIGICEWDR